MSALEQVRRFNRLVTRRAGALESSYLGRGRPLGQARLLFEIGPEGCELGALRDRLGLDSGYLSRLLRSLCDEGLALVETEPDDARRRRAVLTSEGQAEWRAYDSLSDDLAGGILSPLSAAQVERLTRAMGEVERLLTAASVTVATEPPGSAAARACLAAYYRELDERFEGGFDPASGGYSGGEGTEWFLMARLDGRPVGCGVLKALDERTGEIKRMWVAPEMRGLGLSRRLLGALEEQARGAGMQRVRLDTNRSLTEARALYEKAGYRPIPRYNYNPYADFWFEKELPT